MTGEPPAGAAPGSDDGRGGRWARVEREVEGAAERFVDEVEDVEEAVERALPAHLRARQWAHRRRSTHILWHAVVLFIGLGLIVAGVVMLVLPGPGWGSIILGLVVLASEYAWARRLLDPLKRVVQRAAERARDPRDRRRGILLLAVGAIALAALTVWYVVSFGFTLRPIADLFTGA